ncbi:FAD-binding oxidoreductase [Nocardia sp. NBC_01327]|uniref:FAD-binding oxidoreductase n=1 Tax=Nocardia sp. NBC_01327 TaxID=2903593 RepID=UPI002E111CB6|nr:FAD-binding oxidoreductase [Nocardia sp. NBC_01327]
MRWQPAELLAARFETPSARTLTLRVPGWPGHLPGQHVDVRLTAPDGYQAERSYSLAAPADGDTVQLTVQRVPDGEVSGYLVDALPVGALIEIRGPVGGWFVWNPDSGGAAVLVAGGSGIVPLAAMLRARRNTMAAKPFRLIYTLRAPEDLYYRDELLAPPGEFAGASDEPAGPRDDLTETRDGVPGPGGRRIGLRDGSTGSRGDLSVRPGDLIVPGGSEGDVGVFLAYSRSAPVAFPRPAARLTAAEIAVHALPPAPDVTCYVCGPTPFVEFAATALVSAGHDPAMIRTERFGPTGK